MEECPPFPISLLLVRTVSKPFLRRPSLTQSLPHLLLIARVRRPAIPSEPFRLCSPDIHREIALRARRRRNYPRHLFQFGTPGPVYRYRRNHGSRHSESARENIHAPPQAFPIPLRYWDLVPRP